MRRKRVRTEKSFFILPDIFHPLPPLFVADYQNGNNILDEALFFQSFFCCILLFFCCRLLKQKPCQKGKLLLLLCVISIIFTHMSIKVLFLGEIVGRAGIQCVKNGLKSLKEKYSPDYIVANAEGTTNGFGLGKAHAAQLSKLGIDLLTGGEKLFYKVDLVEGLNKMNFILRPCNFPQATPGKGYKSVMLKDKRVCIINLLSTSGFPRCSVQNPFSFMEYLLPKLKEENDIILVQFHSATTAESATLYHFLDGKAAAIISTHSKVLTADSHVSENRTAFISDNGRCGSALSVGGFDSQTEIHKLLTCLPERSKEAWSEGELQGVLVTIGEDNLAEGIEVVREKVEIERPEAKEKP